MRRTRTRDCKHISDESEPAIGEAGQTGEWRSLTPVIDHARCTPSKQKKESCFLCWLYCPDAVIKKTVPVQIDLKYCKGCGICTQICPARAITMV